MFNGPYKFLFPGLLAVYSFINIKVLDGDRLYQADLPLDKLFYIIFILCYAVWFVNAFIEKYNTSIKIKIQPLLLQFGFSIIGVFFISLSSILITEAALGEPFSYSFQNLLLTSGFAFRINLFLNCINAILYFSKRYKEKAVEAEKLHSLNVEAQLVSLNSQINPHFFFNNLSTLSSLIHEDPKLADEYLQKLSTIYRHILSTRDKELIPLKEELAFLDNYISLLSIRFQKSLKFSKNISSECKDLLLPPSVLQLLVENVVKHNYFTEKEPLTVTITSDCEQIKIHNKKQKKDVVEYSSGIGLQNISERYSFLDKKIVIIDEKEYFQISLPLIHEDSNSRRRATYAE
ncbi:sensor histidine kinase [Belliella pelovolcani]|uniref:Histidine kinase n=1 Tax=Belliella pelovolcani TaxID=529505 RepID=A0A1N7LGV3_9BACT|nr:histidine kinase [Belliella pelovolcani]SIS73055.1 Histidine kinase [Belliella pelovolcani]